MSGRIAAMEICLEQLLEYPSKMVYDEQQLHFKRWEYMKYKTLKTAFIKDRLWQFYDWVNISNINISKRLKTKKDESK